MDSASENDIERKVLIGNEKAHDACASTILVLFPTSQEEIPEIIFGV